MHDEARDDPGCIGWRVGRTGRAGIARPGAVHDRCSRIGTALDRRFPACTRPCAADPTRTSGAVYPPVASMFPSLSKDRPVGMESKKASGTDSDTESRSRGRISSGRESAVAQWRSDRSARDVHRWFNGLSSDTLVPYKKGRGTSANDAKHTVDECMHQVPAPRSSRIASAAAGTRAAGLVATDSVQSGETEFVGE